MTTADASLKIEVVSTGIQEASRALGGLSTSAANAEKRVTKLTSSIDKLMGSMTALAKMQGTATSAAEAHINKLQSGTAAMQAMTSSAHATTKTLQQLQSQATKAGNAFGHSHEKANILNNTLKSMMVAASAYISLNFAKSIVESADAWGMMQAKLKIATGTMEQAKMVQQELFDMAQKYRSPLDDMGKLYTRLAPALRKYGMEHKDTQQMVEGVTLALKLNGATTAEAASTMLQFSQAANAGRLNGAEFNSISENGTLILMALEKYLGKTRGELKKMGSDGELTFNLIAAAMKKELPEMQRQFSELPLTVEGAMQRIKNAWAKAVGEEGQRTALGKQIATLMAEFEKLVPVIAEKVVGAIRFLIDNGDKLIIMFNSLVALKVTHWAVEVYGGFKKIYDATAIATPAIRVMGAAMAFMGGPLGLIAAALAAGATAWALWGNTAKSQSEKVASTSTILATTSDTTTKAVVLDTDKRIEAIQREIQALNERNRAAGADEKNGGSSRELLALLQQRATAWKSMEDANTPAAAKANLAIAVQQYDIDIKRLASAEQSLYLQKSESKWAENYAKFMEDHGSKEEKFLAKKKKAMEELGRFYNTDIENRIRSEVFGDSTKKTAAEKEESKLLKLKNKEISNMLENRLKSVKAIEDETGKLEQQIDAQKEYNARINQTATQVAELDATKLEEQATTLQGIAIKKLDKDLDYQQYDLYMKQVTALQELANLKREGGILQDQKKEDKLVEKEMDKLEKDWEKTIDKIDDVFRDGFADMLNNGKSAWKSFTKSLATTFKTMIAESVYKSFAKPFVMNIIGNVAGAMGFNGVATEAFKSAGSASGQGISLLSMGKTIWDGFSTGFSGVASTLGKGLTSVGNLFGSNALSSFGTGMQGASIGPVMPGASGAMGAGAAAAKALPIIGWIAAGMMKNASWYDQGWRPENGSISTAGKIIGSPTLIPDKILRSLGVSGKVASILTGSALFARAFGRKDPEVTSFGVQGDFTDEGFIGGQNFQRWKAKGGWFRSDKEGTNYSPIDADFAENLGDSYKALKTTALDFADTLGISATAIEGYRKGLVLDLTGDEAKDAELVAAEFGKIGDELAEKLLPSFKEFVVGSETAGQVLQRLAEEYKTVDNVLNSMGMSFNAVGLSSMKARELLIGLSGGLEAFVSKASFFVQNFLTEAEQMAPVISSVKTEMTKLGYASVDTKDEFKNLVKGLDLTKEADAKLYASLMNLAPAFLQTVTYAEKIAEEAISKAKEKAEEAKDVLKEAYDRESGALKDFIKKFEDFGKSLRKFRDDLLVGGLSNLSPEAKYLELRNRFESTYASAMTGDETALGALQGVSEEFLQASQGYFASSAGYTSDFELVRSAIQNAAISADAQVDIGKLQLSAMERSVAGILSVKEELVSVKTALMNYLNAANKAGTPSATSMIPGAVTAPAPTGNSDVDFVESLYSQYLGRASDASGLQYYVDRLAAGAAPTDIMQNFLNSAEFKSKHGFANGGNTQGWSWVGEQGPELAYFGDKAHIYTANQSKQMTSGGSDETDALLREVVTELKAQTKQGAAVAGATVDRLERVVDKLDKNARKIAAAGAD